MNISINELTEKMSENGIRYKESNALKSAAKSAPSNDANETEIVVSPNVKFVFVKERLVRFSVGDKVVRVYNPRSVSIYKNKRITIVDGDKKYDISV